MDMGTKQIVQRAVETIVAESDPEEIVLFGSFARGDARPDSDLDLLVIQSEPFTPQGSRRKILARLARALMDLPVPKDVLLFTRDEVEELRRSPSHVVAQALREGEVLYARS